MAPCTRKIWISSYHIYRCSCIYILTMFVFLAACFSKDIEDQCNGTLYLKRRCVQNTTENYLQYKQSLSERKWPTDEFFKYVLQSLNCHDNLHFVEVERVMHQNALCWSVMGTDPKITSYPLEFSYLGALCPFVCQDYLVLAIPRV